MSKDGELLTFKSYQHEWIRYSLVLNIPNQKYTIGRNFLGRETQGEFIYWPFDGVEDSHCEIFCDQNGTFWVTPLNDNPTFIDNKRICDKQELKFGSYLTLGEEYRIIRKIDEMETCIQFLFKEREYKNISSSMFQNNTPVKNHDFVPGQNELILSKITPFLSHSDLKTVRELSNPWNKEACKILKHRSIIKFNLHANGQLFQYLSDKNNMKISSWKLKLLFSVPNLHHKLIEDLDLILANGHIINELILEIDIYSQQDVALKISILKKLGKSLKHLEFAGNWRWRNNLFIQPPNFEFPNLISLKFAQNFYNYDYLSQFEAEPFTTQWISNLTKCCPRVRRISIPRKLDHVIYQPVLKKLVELPQLEEVMLGEMIPELFIFALLSQVRNPLKVLWLEEVITDSHSDCKQIEQILEINSNSLESLKLSFKAVFLPKIIRLPKLAKLKYLSIEVSFCPGVRDFTFEFPDSEIVNYEQHFPSLQHLLLKATNVSLYSKPVSDIDDVLAPFLHEGATRIRKLELFCDKHFLTNKVPAFFHLFPNVQQEYKKSLGRSEF